MTKTLTEQQIRKIIEKGTLKAAKVCEKKFYGKPKSLIEQWREGTLSMGYYYVSRPTSYGGEAIEYLDDDCSFGLGEDIIQDVLAPVPSYDEFKQLVSKTDELVQKMHILEKQLEIATKALKQYSWGDNWLSGDCRGQVFLPTKYGYSIADNALDEMEEVK